MNRVATVFGKMLRRWGWRGSKVLEEVGRSYASLTDPETRRAFLHTLRSVIDSRGQRVSASDLLYLAKDLPALIIWGDSDPVIPVKHGRATHSRLPGSRLDIVPHVGHYPHVEAPERFCASVMEFISASQPAAMTNQRRRELMLAVG